MTNDEAISSKFRCYLEMNKGNVSFKARPKYRGDSPWYDWRLIKWDITSVDNKEPVWECIPAKILCIFDKVCINENKPTNTVPFVLIHSCY